jgi:hypothetical protein
LKEILNLFLKIIRFTYHYLIYLILLLGKAGEYKNMQVEIPMMESGKMAKSKILKQIKLHLLIRQRKRTI